MIVGLRGSAGRVTRRARYTIYGSMGRISWAMRHWSNQSSLTTQIVSGCSTGDETDEASDGLIVVNSAEEENGGGRLICREGSCRLLMPSSSSSVSVLRSTMSACPAGFDTRALTRRRFLGGSGLLIGSVQIPRDRNSKAARLSCPIFPRTSFASDIS